MEALQINSLRDQLNVRKERLNNALEQKPGDSNLVGLLKQVDSALNKIDHGTYGVCEVCHDAVEEERLFIDPLVSVCLGCLDDAQRHALESDLEFAAKIQRNLLPKNNQSISGWDFSYHYNPAGPVSGDFTDIIPLNDDSVIFIIGDVSGKGISASLMMSHLHGLIHSLLSFGLPVNELLKKASRLFNESTIYSNYATIVIGKAYPDGAIEVAVAGHNPPLLLKNGSVHQIPATGMPVGLFADAEYGVNKFRLDKDDTILLYTDGLTESSIKELDGLSSEYGEQRVVEQLSKVNGTAPKHIIDELIRDHKTWLKDSRPSDDVTILVVKRTM
ncbi:MAG: SpoIIE family protein phosphatase [Ignavibacteria bacterium]